MSHGARAVRLAAVLVTAIGCGTHLDYWGP